jgi:membrane protein
VAQSPMGSPNPDASTCAKVEPRASQQSFLAKTWALTRSTVRCWLDDNAPRLAASLAYYVLLSLAPLIVLAIALAGMEFGEDAARGEVAREISTVVGPDAGRAIQSIVANAKTPGSGTASTIVGVSVLLLSASGAFVELQSALDTIWGVKPKPGRGLLGAIKDRGFSLAMVLCVAFLLMVSLILSTALSATGRYLQNSLPGGETLWQLLSAFLSIAVTTLLFGLMLKIIPDAAIGWRDVWMGALVTSLLFTLGKTLLGLYIGKFWASSTFGAASSLVALLVWVYYSSQVLFLGAEFTKVYACRFGKAIRPSDNAVAVRTERELG